MQKTTLLLDLDDTLLDLNMDVFIPAYSQALAAALAEVVAPEVMLPALMGGTRDMMTNTDPTLTLREVFDAHFFPKIGVERSIVQGRIDYFYDEIFPSLEHVTRRRPQAVEFVEWAFAAGHRVVVATNPFFPLKAIHHRLRWAGLPAEKYPFALVSSYETFHFTKENQAYFPELLAQLGWPRDPVVMVGNDLQMDLLPARAAGFPVFWMREGKDDNHPEISQGSFDDLRGWLEVTDPHLLQLVLNTSESLCAALRATPAALGSLTGSLPPEAWSKRPAPREWNLTEILCHWRDVENEVNLPRLHTLLAEENPFLPGVVSDAWVEQRQYTRQDGRLALSTFASRRKDLLNLLSGLQAEWSRPARHAIFGPTTLQEQVGFIAGHDQAHLQQFWKTLRGS